MHAYRKVLVLFLGLLSVFAGMIPAGAAEEGGPILMVIPARYTMVQFANDIASLRETYIVSFEKSKDGSLQLYVWDRTAGDWVKTDLDTYSGGGLFAVPPVEAFVIGTDSDVPPALVSATSFCEMKRVNSLNVVPIANTLNESLEFQSNEWRWLAGRHKLQIVDLNEDRRRYGRYGKPGEKSAKSSAPTGAEEEIDAISTEVPPPPAPKMPGAAETKVETPKPAPAPVIEDKQAMDK